jgi:hypothetical protein
MKQMNPETRKRLQRFGIQMIIYAVLVTIYLYFVWRYLEFWLLDLYEENLPLYAVVCLAFIVIQAVVLDTATTMIMDRLGFNKED